jgi:glycosyltransferase involved in cell wall biosynthesis
MEFVMPRCEMQSESYLIIASDYKPKPGGRADYIDNLARGLVKLGVSTKVVAVVQRDKKERLAFLKQYESWVMPFPVTYDRRPDNLVGNKIVSLLEMCRCVSPKARRILEKASIFRNSVNAIMELKQVIAEDKPTMVVFGHLDMRLYPFALFLLDRRIPYGIIAHESEIYRFRERKNDAVRRGLMLKGARWIAANSRHTKSLVEMWGIPSEKIPIVYPPISEEAIQAPVNSERSRTAGNELKIVSICRLVKPKGIDTVICALKILRNKGIPYRYVIAGDGVERKALEGLVEKLGLRDSVEFKGYITDAEKWSLLADSDVFVMPSRVDPKAQHEGFGIAFVEASALGVPGIGSNEGGIPDAVLDGETGILVPQDSPEDLALALTFLYRNPERRIEMGRTGMERARTQFSPTTIAARFKKEISKEFLSLRCCQDRT